MTFWTRRALWVSYTWTRELLLRALLESWTQRRRGPCEVILRFHRIICNNWVVLPPPISWYATSVVTTCTSATPWKLQAISPLPLPVPFVFHWSDRRLRAITSGCSSCYLDSPCSLQASTHHLAGLLPWSCPSSVIFGMLSENHRCRDPWLKIKPIGDPGHFHICGKLKDLVEDQSPIDQEMETAQSHYQSFIMHRYHLPSLDLKQWKSAQMSLSLNDLDSICFNLLNS